MSAEIIRFPAAAIVREPQRLSDQAACGFEVHTYEIPEAAKAFIRATSPLGVRGHAGLGDEEVRRLAQQMAMQSPALAVE